MVQVIKKDGNTMLAGLLTKLDNLERLVRTSFGRDISSPSGRFWAHIHFHLMDHAFLRVFWNNFHQVCDEVNLVPRILNLTKIRELKLFLICVDLLSKVMLYLKKKPVKIWA